MDELTLHVIDNQCYSLHKPNGEEKVGFGLNVNYRDVVDAINSIIPEDGTKSTSVSRKMILAVILTRHISETWKLQRVADRLQVTTHALIVHYRKQHDKRTSSKKEEHLVYTKKFYVIIDMLSFQSNENKQRIDNLLVLK